MHAQESVRNTGTHAEQEAVSAFDDRFPGEGSRKQTSPVPRGDVCFEEK